MWGRAISQESALAVPTVQGKAGGQSLMTSIMDRFQTFIEHLLHACIVLSPGEWAGSKRQGPCLMDSLLMRNIDREQTRNCGVIQGSKCSGDRRSEGPEEEGGGWFGSDVGNSGRQNAGLPEASTA